MPKLFGREPALVIGFIGALLTVMVSLSLRNLAPDQVGLVVALVSALTGAGIAVFTRPIQPGAFTAVVSTAVALVQGSGLHIAPETIGAINGLILAGLALFDRGRVSPKGKVDSAALERVS